MTSPTEIHELYMVDATVRQGDMYDTADVTITRITKFGSGAMRELLESSAHKEIILDTCLSDDDRLTLELEWHDKTSSD